MISLLVPTRKRPSNMVELHQSIKDTADRPNCVEIVFYIDEDDTESEDKFWELRATPGSLRMDAVIDKRILMAQTWNECYKIAIGPLYHHCADDIRFRTKGWDSRILEEFDKVSDKILFVYGMDGIQNERIGTHGFLHKNWMDTVGYFLPPYFSSDYCDLWLTTVAKKIGRARYRKDLYIEHMHPCVGKSEIDETHRERMARGTRDNTAGVWKRSGHLVNADVNKLQQFINGAKGVTDG